MSETKYTKGPWTRGRYDDLIGANGKRVEVRNLGVRHLMTGRATDMEDEADANTRLIESAADLLEALKEAIEFANSANNYIAGQDLPAAGRWKAVVAKAEGRA